MKSDQTALGLDDPFIDNSRIVFIIDSEIQGILAAAEVIHRVISETGRRGDESSYIFKHHISRIEQQLSYYDRTYAWQDDKDQAVVDYIASMTDGYFCELTSKLFPGLKFPHRTYINER